MSLLNNLNESQREAGKTINGPLLILAGAGSGKTRTITYRIAHMVKEVGISPYHILAVTFTNKAAKEMRERVHNLIGHEAEKIVVSTFHSFGMKMLRMYANFLGYESNFNIYDTDDQTRVVRNILKELGANIQETPKKIVSLISKLKEDGVSPEEYEKTVPSFLENYRIIIETYKKYKIELKKNNAMDFSDLLIFTNELLDKPEILEKVQDRYRYVMVDEYQDTNNIQYQIIKKIAKKHLNICVVGDEDQSIYGFRGANIQNILDFEKDYPNAKVVKLEQNYRSTNIILKAANSVIKSNKSSKGKKLWTVKEGGELLKLYMADDAIDEAYFITQKIIEGHKNGRKHSDFTILYRTNAQSRIFEETLRRFNIPNKVFGGMQFYQRKEIKDIIAYLNVINNPRDAISLVRVLNVPNRKIGDRTIEKMEEYAREHNIFLFEAIKNVDKLDRVNKATLDSLADFAKIIDELIEISKESSVSEVFEALLEKTKYIESISPEEIEREQNIDELRTAILELEKQFEFLTLADYLQETSLVSATDSLNENSDYVKLMTIHNSKGLEFPVVFLTGLEQEIFPGFAALTEDSVLEEERRLCYVAITRAEEELYLSYAKERMVYGRTSYMRPPSTFIEEIPSELVEGKKPVIETKAVEKKISTNIENFNPFKKSSNTDSKYKVGEKVVHKKFGNGIVKDIDDKAITIRFSEGEKKILLAMADRFLEQLN